MAKNTRVISSLLLLWAVSAFAQEVPPPGSITLLPGYHNRIKQGVDSMTGMIWKQGGLEIQYDIGEMAGDYTDCATCGWTKGEVWRRKQVVNGQQVVCVFTNKKRLVVSFPASHANFYTTIRTPEELTDALLMLLTFQSTDRR